MLQNYQNAYKVAETKHESAFIDPPAGEYICTLRKTEYREVAKDGGSYDRFSWELEVISDVLKGSIFRRTEFLPPDPSKAETKLGFIKGAVQICGITPAINILDLPQSLKKCEGAKLKVLVLDSGVKDKAGKPIKNIKFVSCIEKPVEIPDEYFDSSPTDGVPF